jgi:hypothetical protein
MITAVGTAIITEKIAKSEEKMSSTDQIGVLSYEKVEILRRRMQIIKLAENKKLSLDDSTWQFISENGIFEISTSISERVVVNY